MKFQVTGIDDLGSRTHELHLVVSGVHPGREAKVAEVVCFVCNTLADGKIDVFEIADAVRRAKGLLP